MAEMSDDDILAELGVSLDTKKVRARTPREERIIAGFEDILKFREEHGRAPEHGESRDIFERIYAVRLDRLRQLPETPELLTGMDRYGLLAGADETSPPAEALDDDALLAELGLDGAEGDDITRLRHVRYYEEKRAAEDIATRTPCPDFSLFRPLFDQVQRELDTGVRQTRPFVKDAGFSKAAISKGEFFIVGGQLAYIADVGETFRAPNGETDARLRVIYSNGTESDLLLRSLQRGLYKDEGGRRVTEPTAGPLFAEPAQAEYDDYLPTGTLYVLQSRSSHPMVAASRHLVHKIGITGGEVEARIAGAADDPTYLLAPVDVVATYKLYEVNRKPLEALIHRVLGAVRFNIEIRDRFGKPVRPREWFLVPLPIIDELVTRIGDGSIVGMTYDPSSAALVSGAS
jgi:hypothetical protein